MRSSIEVIQLCLANAQRFFLDATKVSSPTAATLFETSLEEYAKAWMLYFRCMKQSRDGVSSDQIETLDFTPAAQDIKKLVAFEKKCHQDLADTPTEDALLKYLRKLEFLKIMLEFEAADLSLYPAVGPHLREFDLEYSAGRISLPEGRVCPLGELDTLCNTLEGALQSVLLSVVGEDRHRSH